MTQMERVRLALWTVWLAKYLRSRSHFGTQSRDEHPPEVSANFSPYSFNARAASAEWDEGDLLSVLRERDVTMSHPEHLWPSADEPDPFGFWSPHVNTVDLDGALEDLDDVDREAQEEGFPRPDDLAKLNAGRLLRGMYFVLPRRFEVYPTPGGEIAITVPGGHARSVIVVCDSDGGALCSVNIDGAHRRARYCDASILPDGFVREALVELVHREEVVP